MKLTNAQITRQDFVDNLIYQMIMELNPTTTEIDWDIEFIGEIRDIVEEKFVDDLKICDKDRFYPSIKE
jgi:DNA polymerase sigma